MKENLEAGMRFLKSKRTKIIAAIILAGFLTFFVWDYYMKTTWDHHIVTDLGFYRLQKEGERRSLSLSAEELEVLSKKYDIPRRLEIVKKGDEYILIGNGKQKITKSVTSEPVISDLNFPEEFRWAVYSNKDKTKIVEVFINLHEMWGCRGIKSNWTGNLLAKQILANGDILTFRGQADVYENFIQYFLCNYYTYQP